MARNNMTGWCRQAALDTTPRQAHSTHFALKKSTSPKNGMMRRCHIPCSSQVKATPSTAAIMLPRLGTRASHGCVRLAPQNAATLFALVEKAGFKNSTFQINGGFFDFGGAPLTSDVGAATYKPFHFFWEAKPKTKAGSIAPKKKTKFKSIFATNG